MRSVCRNDTASSDLLERTLSALSEASLEGNHQTVQSDLVPLEQGEAKKIARGDWVALQVVPAIYKAKRGSDKWDEGIAIW